MLFQTLLDNEENKNRWNNLVNNCEAATYCHLYQWRFVIEKSYALKTYYIILTHNNLDIGLFPISIHPSLLSPKVQAVSLGFCNYGGLLLKGGINADLAEKDLQKYLATIKLNPELRAFSSSPTNTVTPYLDLPKTTNELWQQLNPKVRNLIRKGNQHKLKTEIADFNKIDEFYKIYAINMKRLGTPVHAKIFFSNLLKFFNENTKLLIVKYNNKPIASMILFIYRNTCAVPFAASLSRYNFCAPNMLMYWEALCLAINDGCEEFDFGRSQINSGSYQFKKQWGTKNRYLYDSGLKKHKSLSFKLASQIWKKLPLSLQIQLSKRSRAFLP